MFSASAAYAQAVSAQYGYQSFGGMGVNDPRSTGGMAQAGLQAGAAGGHMARMPGYAAGGLSAMSMFGFGPRILDPFSMTINAASQGFARQGMAGAMGMGGAAIGGYMAMGAGANWATEQMVGGAQNRGMLNAQMSQAFPGMGAQGLGMMSQQVEGQARQGMGNLREITSVMQQGIHSGAVDTQTLTQFSQSFNKLMQNVRNVATVMNTSLQQAQQAMQSVSSMGVAGDQAAGFLGTMKGLGQAAHISPQQMLGVAGAGAEFGRAAGIDPVTGATGAMVSAGVYGYAERHGLIQGITGAAQGRYTQAATRFLGSKQGKTVLGAMMTPGGQFDSGMASQIASGAMTWQEIRGAYNQNITGGEQRDMLNARGGEIAGQFISQHGPQAVSGAVRAAGSTSESPETLMRALTGLNRNDQKAMDMLASNTGQLRTKVLAEAQAGFDEGSGRMGIGQIMSKAIDTLTKPIRQQFQKLGANMTQYYQEAVEDITNQFSKGGVSTGQLTGRKSHELALRINNLTDTGNQFALKDQWSSWNQGGGRSESWDWGGGGATGWAGQMARDFAPMGARIGGLAPGTQFSELPMGGLGLEEYQSGQSALALHGGMRVFGQGRTLAGGAGAAMGYGGRMLTGGGGMAGMFPSMGEGMLGLRGLGPGAGMARMGGGAMRLGGLGMRGLGAAAGMAAMPMMAYDLATNAMPEAMRTYGRSPISAGAITGDNGRLIQALSGAGVLGDDATARHDLGGGSGGMDAQAAASLGMTPIAGTFEQNSGPGSQLFLTEKGRKQTELLMTGRGGDMSSIIQAGGGPEHIQSVLTRLKAKTGAIGYSGTDQDILKEFMDATSLTSGEAYQLMAAHDRNNSNPGQKIFKDDFAKQLEVEQRYAGDPEKANKVVVDTLKKKAHGMTAWMLSNPGASPDEKVSIAENIKKTGIDQMAETLGIDSADLKQDLEDIITAGGTGSTNIADMRNKTGGDIPLGGHATMAFTGSANAQARKATAASSMLGTMLESDPMGIGGAFTEAKRLSLRGRSQKDVIAGLQSSLSGSAVFQDQMRIGADAGLGRQEFLKAMLGEKIGIGAGEQTFMGEHGVGYGAAFSTQERGALEQMQRGRQTLMSTQSARSSAAGHMAAGAGGYADLDVFNQYQDKFEKGYGDPGNMPQDYGILAMRDLAKDQLLGASGSGLRKGMTHERMADMAASFSEGDTAYSQRAGAVIANVNYYTKQWENSKGSPSKFLANITHNPEYNKLTQEEQNFLKGKNASGLTTKLQSMLEHSARGILRAAGKKPELPEVERLADLLAAGNDGDSRVSQADLIAEISASYTPVRPGMNRGGGGAGAQGTVDAVVGALEDLVRRVQRLLPNQSVEPYGG
jgi:hypothetical protein